MTEIPAIIIAALLGALQGFTEFLPISSSAHLYAVPYLFSLNDPLLDSLAFAAVLHLGTLAAVLVAMRHEVVRLTGVVLRFIFSLGRTRGEASDERLIVAIILGTIPAAIAGALASDLIDGALRSPMIVAAAVLAGAALLGVAERFGRRERPLEGIAIFDGIFTGLAQALALIPGISRSGATISAGLLLGFNRASAARFSFLLGIPAIAGGGLLELRKLAEAGGISDGSIPLLLVGIATSFFAGLLAISLLLRLLSGSSTRLFVFYRIAFALLLIGTALSRGGI
jgi:undecaprenyl-diphosphatase